MKAGKRSRGTARPPVWERGDVIVIAMRRGAMVTTGFLSVTYRPISKTIPKEPTGGEPPF
jgi:hypothetical protein